MTKEEIIQLAENGAFLPQADYRAYADLDGTKAAEFLRSKGFEILKNFDTGTNGWAFTTCGIRLSTNGYIAKRPYDPETDLSYEEYIAKKYPKKSKEDR